MKKILAIAGIELGGMLIGFFANRLGTIPGGVLFSLGIVILVISAVCVSGKDK